jgi:hypothetical protein
MTMLETIRQALPQRESDWWGLTLWGAALTIVVMAVMERVSAGEMLLGLIVAAGLQMLHSEFREQFTVQFDPPDYEEE